MKDSCSLDVEFNKSSYAWLESNNEKNRS